GLGVAIQERNDGVRRGPRHGVGGLLRDGGEELGFRLQGSLATGAGSVLPLRVTSHTAAVQVGSRPRPGTSSAMNDGRNPQCQPSRRIMIKATTTSIPSSTMAAAGNKAVNSGRIAICSAAATSAMTSAFLR